MNFAHFTHYDFEDRFAFSQYDVCKAEVLEVPVCCLHNVTDKPLSEMLSHMYRISQGHGTEDIKFNIVL
jgi:hypothetical protein